MMNIERRNGKDKPVIRKALVELDGKPFKYFEAHRGQPGMEKLRAAGYRVEALAPVKRMTEGVIEFAD